MQDPVVVAVGRGRRGVRLTCRVLASSSSDQEENVVLVVLVVVGLVPQAVKFGRMSEVMRKVRVQGPRVR